MPGEGSLPTVCWELLEFLDARGPESVPSLDFPERLRSRDILTLCRTEGLVCLSRIPPESPNYDPRRDCWRLNLTERGAAWLAARRLRLTEPSRGQSNNAVGAEDGNVERKLCLLTDAQREVWDALGNGPVTGKELAVEILGKHSAEDSIRKRIQAIRRSGRRIEHKAGVGYYRPDAPPPDTSGAGRESG